MSFHLAMSEELSPWVAVFAAVTFDTDVGQQIEEIYPEEQVNSFVIFFFRLSNRERRKERGERIKVIFK